MKRQHVALLIFASLLVLLLGCPAPQTQAPVEPPELAIADQQDAPVQLTAYINVASGCQVPTIELLEELVKQSDGAVSMEMIDFGTPSGVERMKEDGIDCLTLLFDGSPVIRIPGEDGEKRTVMFYYPAGFGWTLEDLEQTFAAIESGKAEFLSEEETRKVLAPLPIEMTVAVAETDEGVNVLMNGEVAFTIIQGAGDQTPLERAEAAKSALEAWTSGPVHPHQVRMAEKEDGWSVTGSGNELTHVYKVDAEAAGVASVRECASEWVRGIKQSIMTATRNANDYDEACDGDCDHECDGVCHHEAADDDGEDDAFVGAPCCNG